MHIPNREGGDGTLLTLHLFFKRTVTAANGRFDTSVSRDKGRHEGK